MNIFDNDQKKAQNSSLNLFLTHSKAVALTLLAGLALAPQAQAAQKTSSSNKKTVKQTSSKKDTKTKTTQKTDNSVKDVYPEEDKPMPLARELYYKLVVDQIERDFYHFKTYFQANMNAMGNVIKSNSPCGLEGHLEIDAAYQEAMKIYEGAECHSDISIFKGALQKILKENETKKLHWEKYQADKTKREIKQDSKKTTKPKKEQQTKLPLIEERYLDRLLSEINHPKFDKFITSLYTPNWLTFHANEMKKSKSITPEKSAAIDQVSQKYQDIFENDCEGEISNFKTKVQEIYSQNKINTNNFVKDVYPEEDKPMPLARELYYELVAESIEEDFDAFKKYFSMVMPQAGHNVKQRTPFGLEGHLEIETTYYNLMEIYASPECHSDLLSFKEKLQKMLKDNEDKKARWEKYQADQSKKDAKKDSKTTTSKKSQQTKLPLIEERYLDRLLSEINHPEFDRFITSLYTPNWLTFHAEEMKKSKSITPEKAAIIDKVHQKYENIFKNDCDGKINKFKTKVQEIYSQNKINTKVASYTSPILMRYNGNERA